jgi:predicted AlkP superfamily pyrophosphatase or phosphodiesterase
MIGTNVSGDLLLIPHLPKIFNLSKSKTTKGKHGFDNHLPDMRASFMAWGPAFKKGIKIAGFENVNVYPLSRTYLRSSNMMKNKLMAA